MSQGKSLVKNTFIYAIGNFGSKVLAFLLLPLYSFYLNAHDLGLYDLCIATVSLLVPFITLQISDAVYRWLLDLNEKKDQTEVISTGIAVMLSLSVVFYIIYYGLSFFYKQPYSNYIGVVLLTTCYLPLFQQVIRGLKNNKLYAISGVLNTFLMLLLNVFFLVVLKMGLISLFLATIISNSLTILYILIASKLFSYISLKYINVKEMKKMLAYSWPLIPNAISWWLINVADKYLILYLLNIEANGIYAVSSRFPAIITLFNAIFLMAFQDHGITTKEGEENTEFFSKTFDKFINFEITLAILLVSFSQLIITYFISHEFYESYKYMPLLYIGAAYAGFTAYLGVGYQRVKATKGIFKTTLIGGVVNICISLFLLKHIGLYAPALGTFVSFLVIYLIRKYQTNDFFPIHVNNKKLIFLTVVALIYPIQYYSQNIFYQLSFIAGAIILFAFFNREMFTDLLQMVKSKIRVKRMTN
jgi:O-antigen/teichoic acid export membrane protein